MNDPYAWMDENERDARRRGSRLGTPASVRQATKAEADEWWRRAVGEEVGESDVRDE